MQAERSPMPKRTKTQTSLTLTRTLRKTLLLSITALTLISSLQALSMDAFSRLFSECFSTCYRSGKCHANALHLLLKARRNGIDVSPAAYWDLTPYSGGHFYMINVYEAARGAGSVREPPYDWMPQENWFNHGIIVFRSGTEEPVVFDFDYNEVPTPVLFSKYRQEMFYKRNNDQILKVKVHHVNPLLLRLDKNYSTTVGQSDARLNEPNLAYDLSTWEGVGNPDEILLLSEHSLTSKMD